MTTLEWQTLAVATIALVGAGEYQEDSRTIDEHLLGLLDTEGRPARVVCLPTAASTEGETVWRGWAERGQTWFAGLGADAVAVDVIDRDSADDPAHAATVAEADLVYFSGGKPTHLYDTLVGTAVWAAVESVLATGGILAGCSAGAMIQGGAIASLRRAGAPTPGFGLLSDVIVLPHFDEFPSMVQGAVRRLLGRGHTVVGIDGGTALVRHQGLLRAVGRGNVSVFGREGTGVFHDEPVPTAVL